MANNQRVPHTLRLITFLLRLALGANFFYLGFTTLFNAALERELRGRSFTDLYSWVTGTSYSDPLHMLFEWAFLIIGVCLVIGLATRLASIGGIILVLMSYLPAAYRNPSLYQFIDVEVIVILCLLVLIFSNAGSYLGLDNFFHVHFASKHKE